jgi:ankyrin repeat protein
MENIHDLIFELVHFHEDIVDQLKKIITKENVKSTRFFGRTPLHDLLNCSFLLSNQERTVLSILLQHGADFMDRDEFGNTGYHYLARRGEFSFLDQKTVHLVNYNNETPLFFAVFAGQVNCVKELLDLGAKLSHKDGNGKTIFDRKSEWGNEKWMEDFFVKNKMMKRSFWSKFKRIFSE